jgi:hypothetical protein
MPTTRTPKTTSLNFRTDPHVAAMLRRLAEATGISMTDYIETFIRASFRAQYPREAAAYETPAERYARTVVASTRGKR